MTARHPRQVPFVRKDPGARDLTPDPTFRLLDQAARRHASSETISSSFFAFNFVLPVLQVSSWFAVYGIAKPVETRTPPNSIRI